MSEKREWDLYLDNWGEPHAFPVGKKDNEFMRAMPIRVVEYSSLNSKQNRIRQLEGALNLILTRCFLSASPDSYIQKIAREAIEGKSK